MATKTSKKTPRWERRAQARPEEIVAAALELFVERGYAHTRLEEVARRAGVSKGTLYLYFANKEKLFEAVIGKAVGSHIAEMKELIGRYRGSSKELLHEIFALWWERVASRPAAGIPKLIIGESGNFPEIARAYVQQVINPGLAVFRAVAERGMRSGEFRQMDPVHAVVLINAPLLFSLLWRSTLAKFSPLPKLDLPALLREHVETVCKGFAP